MLLKTTTSHEINFNVKSFTETEGGMNIEVYGGVCGSLTDAVALLSLARVAFPKELWVIVADVATKNIPA